MTPVKATDYVKDKMMEIFPLGVYKDSDGGK